MRLINQLVQDGDDIQIYGKLIHNKTVLEDLKGRGIESIESLKDLDRRKKLVIRTHGIPRQVEANLKRRKIAYVDATCPLVKKIHKIIKNLNRRQTRIILIGDKKHPEIIAASSYSKKVIIINSAKEAEDLSYQDRTGVVTQTTLNWDFFKEIIAILVGKAGRLEVYNTVCSATMVRQEAIKKLAPEVDFVVVVGGKNSSNTRKLFDIALERNRNTFHVEKSDDLYDPGFIGKIKAFKSVGITAGASTPPGEVERVKEFFENISNKIDEENKNG